MWVGYLAHAFLFTSLSNSGNFSWDTPEKLACNVRGAVTSVRLRTTGSYSQYLFANVSSSWAQPPETVYSGGRIEMEGLTPGSSSNSFYRIEVNEVPLNLSGLALVIGTSSTHTISSPVFPKTLAIQLFGGPARTFISCISFHAQWKNISRAPILLEQKVETDVEVSVDSVSAWFIVSLLFLLSLLVPLVGYLVHRRSTRTIILPNVEDIEVTAGLTSWSFGHEANVRTFPTDVGDKHYAMTLSHKFLCPCIGFAPTGAVFAVPYSYQTFNNALLEQETWEGQILKWCEQIAVALQYLHSRGMVHGNLTADSILLSPDHSFILLLDYLHPGRLNRHPWHDFDYEVTQASDLWDLGWIIWTALNKGNAPMTTETRSFSKLPVASGSFRGYLYDIVQACWNKEPLHRPPLGEIIRVLQDEIRDRCDADDNEHGIVWNV